MGPDQTEVRPPDESKPIFIEPLLLMILASVSVVRRLFRRS